jgi:dolichyl-phosphate beta-glucosyltransferase
MAVGEMPTLSLVFPAYNEEARLPRLLEVLGSSAPDTVASAGYSLLEAVIVDDGSSDRTAQILRTAAQSNPLLRPVLELRSNSGKGAAVAAGVRAVRGDYVLQADVDLSTPLQDLEVLADAVRCGADMAIGSRDIEGSVVEDAPLHRRYLGEGFNLVVRSLTGLPYRDTQCGFKLMPSAAGKDLLETQICRGFSYDVELLLRARLAGLTVAEVPVSYVHDPRSRVRMASASVQMLRDVMRLSYSLRMRGDSTAAARNPGAARG